MLCDENNLMAVESLQVFKHKSQYFEMKLWQTINSSCKVWRLTSSLQMHSNSRKGDSSGYFFNLQDSNMRNFFWRVNKIVEYLGYFPPFRTYQKLSNNKIIYLIEFALPRDYQKRLLMQRFYFPTQILNKIVDFCEATRYGQGYIPIQGWWDTT